MKYVETSNNYINFVDTVSGDSLGYGRDSITYKIHETGVNFFAVEDYLYEKPVWSASIPLVINGQSFTKDDIGEGLKTIFNLTGVYSVNGMTGDVTFNGENLNVYTKEETYSKTELDWAFSDVHHELSEKLETDNIIAGENITIEKSENDLTFSAELLWGQITGKLDNQEDLSTALNGKAPSNKVNELETQIDSNTTRIEVLENSVAAQQHFRGYFATNAEIQNLPNPVNGDYAWSSESGTVWSYYLGWVDTEVNIPDKTVPKSTSTPLMDSTNPSVGVSNAYAPGDHVHPTDSSRASLTDFQNHLSDVNNPHSVTKVEVGLGNVDNTSDVNKPVSMAVQTALNGKQTRLEGVTDIRVVNELPPLPVNTILYLLPE
jgi:hypothetical protein